MAENITTLGIEVKTSGVQQASSDLQKLASSAKSTEQSTSGMTSALDRVNAQIKAMGDKAKGASNAAQSAWRNIESGIKPVEQAVQKVANSFDKAAKSAEGFGGASASVAKGGVAAFAIIKAWEMVAANIGKAIDAADEYTRIESRLRQISGGASGAADLQKELYTVAQESRQSFTELANTYAQVARATQDLGISQTELLNITKTVSQAVALSGSSTQAAQAAMVQFSQAMASGTLRGEELNSIMEQTPRLAQAIAQGLGVGIGELRRLGQQGELTAKQVLDAIAKSAGNIDREFKSMTPTVADGFTQMGNSAKNFIDVINDATGASRILYGVLSSLSKAMDFTASGVKTGVQNARTGVLEAEISRLQTQINSLGKGDFRLSGLQAQLDAKQTDLYKSRGTGLAGGAEMPVLSNPAAKGASVEYLALTQKMSGVSSDFYKNLKILNAEYGRTGNLKNYQAEVKKLIETETEIGKDSIKKTRGGGSRVAKEPEEAKAYEKTLLAISAASNSAQKSTLELTVAESALYDVQNSPMWERWPETWRQTAIEQANVASAAEKTAKFLKNVEAQEQANVKGRQGMIEQIQAAEKATEMYGLTEAQISVVEQARLRDAIAMLEEKNALNQLSGASEEETNSLRTKIDVLKEELSLRGKLSDAIVGKERKAQELDDAKNAVKGTSDDMTEFMKKAAQNMQDAFAEFLFDPFAKGTKSMAQQFGETVRKMIAQAGSAQLLKLLFGDLGNTGNVGGLFGDIFKSMAGSFSFSSLFGGSSAASSFIPYAWAYGGAVENGNVKRFASGGAFGNGRILTKPTMFALGGTMGIAGEAGPEGALPLKRMSNGKLGVHMSGSQAMTINQTINAGAGTDKAEVKRAAASGARAALGVMSGARRYG